ncbi:MAG: hypothetical protein V8R11_05300 [Alphaproteobacteria bacterium]
MSAAEKIVGARRTAVPSDNRQAAVSDGNRRAQTAIGGHRQ